MEKRTRKTVLFIGICVSFFWNSTVFSQTNYTRFLDSLNTEIKIVRSDTVRVRLMEKGIYSGLNHSDLEVVGKYLGMMKKELDVHPWDIGQMVYHHANGIFLFYNNDYKGSLRENLSSLKIAKQYKDVRSQARSYGNIALIYQVQADYLNSLKFHFKGLEMEKKLKNTIGIADSYNNIGIVYENLGQFKKSLWFQTKSVQIRLKIKDYVDVSKNYSNIGNIYFSMNNMDSALSNYNRGLKFAEKLEDENAVAISIANIANVYYVQKKYKQAISFCLRSFKTFLKVGNDRGWIASAGNLGENYFELNRIDSARYYTEMSVNKAAELNAKDLELTCLKTLVKINEKEQRYKDAFYVQQHLYSLRDSVEGEEKKSDLARFEVKHEYALKEERRKAKAILEKRKQNIILYSVIAGLIISLLFGFVVLRSLNTNKKKNKIIHDQKIMVEAKQKEVMDSIHYAKRIQEALLPSERYMIKNMDRLNK